MARQTFESAAFNGEEQKPIDPAFLAVQRRLRRLMFIGGGTLGIGIITTVFTAFTLTRLIVAAWVRWRRPQRVPI